MTTKTKNQTTVTITQEPALRKRLKEMPVLDSFFTKVPNAAALAHSLGRTTRKKEGTYFSASTVNGATRITKFSIYSRKERLQQVRNQMQSLLGTLDLLIELEDRHLPAF